MSDPLRVLSFGGGVQSTAVLVLSAEGHIDKLDACIFADTGWEPDDVYEHVAWCKQYAEQHGIAFYTVSKGNLRDDLLHSQIRGHVGDGTRAVSIPLFVVSPNGTRGQVRRQCTREYKVEPIERCIRERIFGVKKYARLKRHVVELWFGISRDEMRRVRMSTKAWKIHRYPLIWDKPMTRQDCLDFLARRNINPRRSACLGCPFHSDAEWAQILANPKERRDVIEVDRAIRVSDRLQQNAYLHRSCQPIESLRFDEHDDECMQMSLWDNECLGYCGN